MNNPDKKKCILCIDDDKGIHSLLETHLAANNFVTLHAMHGKEALHILKDNQVDLIILDINMPNMDGFQTLRSLKTEGKTYNIPVIFLSSMSRENLKVKGLEYGADDFIVKPFTGPELIARIKAVIRRNEPQLMAQKVCDVQGSIEEHGLFELMHMFSFSGKNAVITFPDMEGELVVAGGSVLSVRQGDRLGKEALLTLFFIEKGSFCIVYKERSGEAIGKLESLLFFIGSALDEVQDKVATLGGEETKLHLAKHNGQYPEIEQLKDSFPVSASDLALAMPGGLEANLEQIQEALQSGILTTEEE